MRKLLLFFLTLALSACAVQAAISFDANTKYRFSCKAYGSGSLVLGANHGSSAYLYYQTSNTFSADSWWYIRAEGEGYTLLNASDGKYITYDAERIPDVAKGLVLTDTPQGAASQWKFAERNGFLVIQSVGEPGQWFNLRQDGTYLMGTYAGTGSDNELFSIFDEEGNEVNGEETNVQGDFHAAFNFLCLDGKQPAYDETSRTYLMPLPTALRGGGSYSVPLTYQLKAGYEGHSVTIGGQSPAAGSNIVSLENVDCGEAYPIVLNDAQGRKVASSEVRFTFLPVVEINMPGCTGSFYTDGRIRVTDADSLGANPTYIASYKYRGVTAQKQEKKAYNIKLRDAQGNSIDHSFFGLRSDNNWILDAMAIDPACMRNRVATDLWNDFSAVPYYKDREPKALTGTRGRFVEVLLNGSYHGIYCMTEKLDRKQLKLKKYKASQSGSGQTGQVRGLLYKSAEWSYEVLMGHDPWYEYFPGNPPRSYSNNLGVEGWASYEIKYPDYEDEAVEWKPLWDAVNFVATKTGQAFESEVKERFDFPVVVDYYLYIDLLLASDNHGKNMFFYVYDQTGPEGGRMGFAPWDLDGTWGGRWDGSTNLTFANQDFDEFLWKHENGQHTLYYKLKNSTSLDWQQHLASRYAELRSTYFAEENLSARIAAYAALFAESGADEREAQRWPQYHGNLQGSADYAQTWIGERLEWLDSKYGYDPEVVGINAATAENYFSVTGGKGRMAVTAGKAQVVRIHHLSGRLVRTVQLNSGLNVVDGLQPGIYLVGGQKVAVE